MVPAVVLLLPGTDVQDLRVAGREGVPSMSAAQVRVEDVKRALRASGPTSKEKLLGVIGEVFEQAKRDGAEPFGVAEMLIVMARGKTTGVRVPGLMVLAVIGRSVFSGLQLLSAGGVEGAAMLEERLSLTEALDLALN
jgi:hypothetical protein